MVDFLYTKYLYKNKKFMNITNYLEKWLIYVLYGISILTILDTCNGCILKKEVTRTKKEVVKLQNKVDTLSKEIINRKEIEEILENDKWEFLILEELSDKEHIPINELKYKKKKEQNE